jgi:TonB family protein
MTGPMQPVMQREREPEQVSPEQFIELPSHSRLPRLDLGVDWGSPWAEFRSSWRDFFDGTKAPDPAELPADSDLRVDWIEGKVPRAALGSAIAWHMALIGLLFLPIWHFLESRPPDLALPRIELTWTNPSQDLPPISMPGNAPEPSPQGDPNKPLPQTGADAFHPRQTILSQPVRANHPRQTLIQPDAPSAPPKIETSLPNIAEWAATPAPPKPQWHTDNSAAAPQRQHRTTDDLTAPEIANQEKTPGELNIAPSPTVNLQPRMPMSAMSKATERQATHAENAAAPEVGNTSEGDANLHRLIAISAAPAPPAPEVIVPQGNLSARVAISPDGKQPGSPGGVEHGSSENGGTGGGASSSGGAGKNSAGNGTSFPAAVSVSGDTHSSNGGIAPAGRTTNKLILKPLDPNAPAVAHKGPSVIGPIDPSLPPEKILSGKEVYTLHVNMPNLTSISGNWVMNFAQLDEGELPYHKPKGLLSGPIPERKVDPKYPQTLIKEKVDGEVILYAIIRKDGTVDSIQLVRGIDPQLDKNSMDALSRWVFRPGARDGEPVDLEAVVHIPFHFRKPE